MKFFKFFSNLGQASPRHESVIVSEPWHADYPLRRPRPGA